jgi:hypothetical protein
MSISPRQINRVLNLTFKVAGLKGQIEAVDQLLKVLSMALKAVITLNLTLTALESTHPYFKVISLLIAGLSAISMFSDLGKLFDVSGAR